MTPHETIEPMGRGQAFSVSNKVFRVFWQVAWLLLARWTPPPLFGWRRLVLRMFGAKVGAGARIYSSVDVWHPANLSIGERTIVGPGARLYNQGTIAIGARSVISQRAHICASTHDTRDPSFALLKQPIDIGDGCWIAAEAFIGPGVKVANGAIVGARAALFDDAEQMAIYRGNPAQKIAPRELLQKGET